MEEHTHLRFSSFHKTAPWLADRRSLAATCCAWRTAAVSASLLKGQWRTPKGGTSMCGRQIMLSRACVSAEQKGHNGSAPRGVGFSLAQELVRVKCKHPAC